MTSTILKENLLDLIKGQIKGLRQPAILSFYHDYKDVLHYGAGSSHNHQAWDGGYADHIAECLRINFVTFDGLSTIRSLDFTIEEAAMALFFHDIEKPFRYGPVSHEECRVFQETCGDDYEKLEKGKWNLIEMIENKYDFQLTKKEKKAIRLAHGEGDEYKKTERVSSPLDAHVHHCDNTSARIWPEQGKGLSLG